MSPIFVSQPAHLESHAFAGYRAPLMGGEAGTAQTVALMRKLIDQAVGDQSFVRQAIDIVRHVPAYNDLQEASTLYDYVTRTIRYTKDPVTKEKLYPPGELLKIRAGDCDDIAMLMGALGIALGYPARLITISSNSSNPEEFTHVYTELEVPPGSGEWVPMDAARPGATFGVEPPAYFRKRAWSLTDESYADLSGCHCGGSCSSCQVGTSGLCGLNGYAQVPRRTLGQDGIDWGGILSQTIQEVPSIVAVASGQPSGVKTAYGSTQTGAGPYGSFATPYTPGYGVPYAGYGSPSASTWISENWPILGIGLLALIALGGRKS
jgi:transglutaminase-like putative cysteine protease